MTTRVQKWGNSLALRIPKPFATEAGLTPNTAVNIALKDGTLVIRPARPTTLRLASLLRKVTKRNIHDESDYGAAVGREVW